MRHSGIVDRMARLIPFKAVKARLAEHAEGCPACAARLAGIEEVRRVLVRAGDLGRMDDIWPAVRSRAVGDRRLPARAAAPARAGRAKPRAWRFAAAALGLAAAVFVTSSAVLYLGGGPDGPAAKKQFRLHYARVDQRAADTFILQAPEDGMVLVWVGKAL